MDRKQAQAMIDEFLADEAGQQSLAAALNKFALLCAAGAAARGFHEDENEIKVDPHHMLWMENQLLQAEIGRIMSEGGEMIEGVRKPHPDTHCPNFPNWVIEGADILIRLGDTLGKRGVGLGAAAVAKLKFNSTREYKHGKNS